VGELERRAARREVGGERQALLGARARGEAVEVKEARAHGASMPRPVDGPARATNHSRVTRLYAHDDVLRRLPMAACIERMAETLAAWARGRLSMPLRNAYAPPHASSFLVFMPAHRAGAAPSYGVKLLCIVPDNPARGLDAHQGAVVLFDGDTGALRAVLDA